MRARSTALVLVFSLAASHLLAAEETTDAERLYLEARRSDDQLTKLLGERWYGLVKQQEWTDATGQFHTSAKYLDHDPGMKWVKLLAEKGSGEERVTKEMTVPLAKLDKRCQSRVRQIEHIKSKVEAAIAAAKEATKSEEQPDGQEREAERGEPEFGAPEDRAPDRMDRSGRPDLPATESTPSPTPDPSMPTGNLDAPVAFPATPLDRPQASVPTQPEQATPEQSVADSRSQEPRLLDSEPWRTDYDQFRSKITTDRGGFAQIQAEQGPLLVLAQLFAEHQQGAGQSNPPEAIPKDGALGKRLDEEVGEFVWEANLADAVGEQNDWTKLLSLPSLPYPVTLTLHLDEQSDQGHWRQFQPGGRVRFIGHFTGFSDQHGLVAEIRFPEKQPTPDQAPQPERR